MRRGKGRWPLKDVSYEDMENTASHGENFSLLLGKPWEDANWERYNDFHISKGLCAWGVIDEKNMQTK